MSKSLMLTRASSHDEKTTAMEELLPDGAVLPEPENTVQCK